MDNTGISYKFKKEYKQFTIRFLDRSVRFLAYSVIALTVLYFLSAIQDFLDSNLFIILNVLITFCILLALFSLAAILVKAFYIIFHKEKKYMFRFIVNLLSFFLGIILAIVFSFLIITAKGNIY